MTAPVPTGAPSTSAVGLLGAAGTAAAASTGAASGAGGDFLSLVLQLLGAPAAGAPGSGEPATGSPAGSVADAPPAAGGGEPATVPGAGKVADAPPAQDPQAGAVVDPALAALLAGLTAGAPNPTAPVPARPSGTTPAGAPGSDPTGAVAAPGAAAAKSPADADAAGAAAAQTDLPVGSALDAPAPAASPTSLAPSGPVPVTAATAVTGPAGTGAPAPVAHQVFDRVVEAIRVSDAGPGPTRVTVRLQPESLGEVRVVMSVRDGALQVSIAGGEPAHHSLLEGAPELRRLLEASGSTDVRVIVRDLARGASMPLVTAATAPGAITPAQQAQPGQHGQSSLDLGAGNGQQAQQQGQQGQQLATGTGQQGHASDRRAPSQPGDPIDIPGTATSPRRTDPVTRTRSAGVDVTM